MKQIAVIGAGIAGIAAARALSQKGYAIILFEKSRALGGRVATRRIEGCILDHGAQVIKPDGSALAEVILDLLPTDDLIQITEPVRIAAEDGTLLSVDPDRASQRQFTYRNGLTTLPKLLLRLIPSENIQIQMETRIGAIEQTPEGIQLWDDAGNAVAQVERVVLTAPAPQAADLLAVSPLQDSPEVRRQIDALRSIRYTQCLSVLLGYAAPAPVPPAYALLAQNRATPLLWLAFEQVKAPERAPNGEGLLIAQLGPDVSRDLYDAAESEVIEKTLGWLRPLFAEAYARPIWSQVKKWRYSQPVGSVDFCEVNREGSPVVCCGDALRPENGRIHQAYASGLEAADWIQNSPLR